MRRARVVAWNYRLARLRGGAEDALDALPCRWLGFPAWLGRRLGRAGLRRRGLGEQRILAGRRVCRSCASNVVRTTRSKLLLVLAHVRPPFLGHHAIPGEQTAEAAHPPTLANAVGRAPARHTRRRAE